MFRAIPPLRPAYPYLLLIFFCFHVFAVGIESIPRVTNDPISPFLRSIFWPSMRPYTLLTSQWQQWNLFGPEPVREVLRLHVEEWQDGEWTRRMVFGPGELPFFREVNVLRVVSMITKKEESYLPLRASFLQSLCGVLRSPEGVTLRLRALTSDVFDESTVEEDIMAQVICSS